MPDTRVQRAERRTGLYSGALLLHVGVGPAVAQG